MEIILVLVVGYLIGSVSVAVIVSKSRGVDIFKEGSGNPGATNVKRVLGSKWGHTVFFLDVLKGVVSAGWPLYFFGDVYLGVLGLVAGVLGHSFSLFLQFKGGKGVATTMGGLLVLMPLVFLIGLLVWLAVFYSIKVVSIASIAFSVSLPISSFFLNGTSDPRFILTLLLAILIILLHCSNIARFIKGEENSFKK